MRDFLCWLLGGYGANYFAELRVLGEEGYRRQFFYHWPIEIDALLTQALFDDTAGLEVYIGVIPRIEMGGTADETYPFTNVLWADVDAKHHDNDKKKALGALLDFPVPPAAIVDSGHGYHAYWKLGTLNLFDHVRPIMKGIAERIGGDHVYDRARILRIPGLSNHKDGGNAPVRLIRFDTTLTYALSDLAEYRHVEPWQAKWDNVPVVYRDDPGNWDRDRLSYDHAAYLYRADIDDGKGTRSGRDYGICVALIRNGWDDERIRELFLRHPSGIGVKTFKRGMSYLDLTIANAHRAVSA